MESCAQKLQLSNFEQDKMDKQINTAEQFNYYFVKLNNLGRVVRETFQSMEMSLGGQRVNENTLVDEVMKRMREEADNLETFRKSVSESAQRLINGNVLVRNSDGTISSSSHERKEQISEPKSQVSGERKRSLDKDEEPSDRPRAKKLCSEMPNARNYLSDHSEESSLHLYSPLIFSTPEDDSPEIIPLPYSDEWIAEQTKNMDNEMDECGSPESVNIVYTRKRSLAKLMQEEEARTGSVNPKKRKLEPHEKQTQISENVNYHSKKYMVFMKKKVTSSQLEAIPGIGRSFAERLKNEGIRTGSDIFAKFVSIEYAGGQKRQYFSEYLQENFGIPRSICAESALAIRDNMIKFNL